MVARRPGAGGLPLLDEAGLEEAQRTFFEDVHAPSQRHVVKAKLQTITRALALWKLEPFPPNVEKVHALGTVLKAGKYKSAESYLSLYKADAERRGFPWTAVSWDQHRTSEGNLDILFPFPLSK